MIVSDTVLVAFADGELDADTMQRIDRLVSDDPQARRKVEMFRETAMLLRAACHESLYAETEAEDRQVPPAMPCRTRPSRSARQRYGWAVAASLAAGIVGFGGGAMLAGSPPSERAELIDEIANYHPIFAAETRHLVEVPADQKAELVAWLGDRLERKRFTVPDLAGAGLQFAGGRMLAMNGRPVAQLMYTRENGRPIGVCLTRMEGPPEPVQVDRRGTLRLASWQDGNFAYIVAGELDEGAVRDIARRAAQQL